MESNVYCLLKYKVACEEVLRSSLQIENFVVAFLTFTNRREVRE